MILIKLLNLDNFHAEDDTIEIAKGKNELPTTLKKGLTQIKRINQWQKKFK